MTSQTQGRHSIRLSYRELMESKATYFYTCDMLINSFHICFTELKITTQYDIDIADPCSMQDACQI